MDTKQTLYKESPVREFPSKQAFSTWLKENHRNDVPFWLRFYKKASGMTTILPTDAVDVALCWGWIDGVINKYGDLSYVVRYTQRRKKSIWSKVNVAKVTRLIETGEMQPSGLAHVIAAQADGRWDKAY